MRPPIIVVADDVDVFETVEHAERYLEPQDVRRGEVRIYDRDGRVVRPVLTKRLLADVVRLEDFDSTEQRVDELRRALVRFLTGREPGVGQDYAECSVDELLERALRYKTL